jgi:hypothetical protein
VGECDILAIRSHGSADGYNTESPEQLHIDFAKAAYRSTNKRDYVEQMAVWLQRQEAIHLRNTYLHWTINYNASKLYAADRSNSDEEVSEAESEESEDEDVEGLQAETSESPTTNTYKIAKRAPFPDMPVSALETQYGAIDFLSALDAFLQVHFPCGGIRPNRRDFFNVYKQISIIPSTHPRVTDKDAHRIVHAIPIIPSRGRKPPSPARFDTIFAVEDWSQYQGPLNIQGPL